MRFVYTDHAEEKLSIRPEITKNMIEYALASPDEIVPGEEGTLVAHKIFGRRLLRVVFDVREGVFVIITIYTSKPERYMRRRLW